MSNFTTPEQFFDTMYTDVAPWDIGAAQPALTDLWNEFPLPPPLWTSAVARATMFSPSRNGGWM